MLKAAVLPYCQWSSRCSAANNRQLMQSVLYLHRYELPHWCRDKCVSDVGVDNIHVSVPS